MANNSLTKMFNPFGDMLDAVDQVNSVVYGAFKEEADYKLRSMESQLQVDINNQMLELQKNNNYEEWPTQIDSFLEKKGMELENSDSKYYCDNQYMAKRAKQMLEAARPGMLKQAEQEKLNKEKEHDIQQYYDNRSADKKNGIYSAQDLMDRGKVDLDSLYKMGRINETQYNKMLEGLYSETYNNSITKAVLSQFDSAIANGESFDDIWSKYEEENKDPLKLYGLDGIEKAVDPTELKNNAKKQLEGQYNTKVNKIQTQTDKYYSNAYTSMIDTEDPILQMSACDRAIDELNKTKGLEISADDKYKWTTRFESQKKLLAAGYTAKGAAKNGVKKSDLQKFEDVLKAAEKTEVLDYWKNSGENGYKTNYIFTNMISEEWAYGDYQENYTLNPAERNKSYNQKYRGRVNGLGDELIKQMVELPQFKPYKMYILGDVNSIKKELQNQKVDPSEETLTDLINYARDMVFSANANTKSEDLKKQWDQHMNSFYLSEQKYLQLDNNGAVKKSLYNDPYKAVEELEANDFVYTDENGKEVWAKGSQEALMAKGGIVDVLKGEVSKTLGLSTEEAGKIKVHWEKTKDGTDINSIPIYSINGQDYKVIKDPNNMRQTQVVNLTTGETARKTVNYNGRKYYSEFNPEKNSLILTDVETGEKLKAGKDFKAADITTQNSKKLSSGASVNETKTERKELETQREKEFNAEVKATTKIPTSVANGLKASGRNEGEWEGSEKHKQQIISDLRGTIDSQARSINKNTSAASYELAKQFKEDYGISVNEWLKLSKKAKGEWLLNH